MYPMAQRTNYLQIFLQVCPVVRIRLDFRAGMNKLRRAKEFRRKIFEFCGFFIHCTFGFTHIRKHLYLPLATHPLIFLTM